ncbi:uncharacterized protein C3orf84 homolog [Tiliqua scincoides]|uniref:uncharacterized protein C3orf84 homolog n=1 Tax=Tiliqua scincoides TaxID=71010 RepID=UPI0034631AB8
MPSPIVGTWHANGFYGNFRSRRRSDFSQEYRKAAQPQPPDLFLKRMKETPSKHIFSKHDNRHAFPGSATYFESGLGRRRIEGSLPNTQNLIDWIPLKEELQRERPLVSSYQSDFRSRDKVPQVLVHHTHQSLQGQPLYRTPSTTYQRTYRSYCLHAPTISAISEQAAKEPKPTKPVCSEPAPPTATEPTTPASSHLPDTNETPTTEVPAPGPFYGRVVPHKPVRLTVSDCLRWHNC